MQNNVAQPFPIKQRAEAMLAGEVHDEEQQRRLTKRESGVAAVKRTPAYIRTVLQKGKRSKTPDPFETMSKRSWEQSMMNWRSDLRAEFHQIHMRAWIESNS